MAFGCALAAQPAISAIFYVNAAANDDSGNGSRQSPKKYIASGIDLMSAAGGDTLVVESGLYSNPADAITTVRNGVPGNYNVIKAAADGGVVIAQSLNLPSSAQYLRFEGLKWDTTGFSAGKSIKGHHIKFLRCVFKGGPATGNNANLSVGTNDATPGAQYILLEDVLSYGLGGRYNIIVYNADKVVLRRVVVRHDGGWSDTKGDPEAGITIYNSSDVLVANSMVIDSNLAYHYWEKAFYHVKNGSSPTANINSRLVGAMAVNNIGYAFGYDDAGPIRNASIVNSIALATGGGVALGGGSGGGHDVTISGMTIANTGGHAFANWGNNGSSLNVKNSIMANNTGRAFGAGTIAHQNNNCYLNSGNTNPSNNCAGLGETAYDPRQNGLLYPIRVEPGTPLKTAGEQGAQVGAEILKRVGLSGTLYGEPGFDSVTSESLWPWPDEQRIKLDVAEISTRGFAAPGLTLTAYIWSFLGNPTPVLAIASPTNARVNPAP